MTEHYGSHAFNLGELRGFRLQVYPTVAALTGDAGTAYARLAFVAENQQFYWGRSGSWIAVPISGGAIPGNGTVIDTVSDPADLNFRRPPVTGTVLTSTPGSSSITVNIPTPGDLDHLTSGDSLVITGSLDSGSNNWLDGTYVIDSVNPTTGEIVVVGGVPEIPVAPAITYGNYTATDLTYPANGSVAVVNPDSAVGGPVLWVFDGLTSSWKRFDDADIRLVFRDGSRTFTVIPSLDPGLTDIPTLIEKLVSKAYLLGQILGYTTGPHYIDSINSAGVNTVVYITTTDSAAMAAAVGKTLRTAGTGTALDGDHVILASSASTLEVANLGVTVSSPPGTTAVYDPGHEFATMNDVTAVGGDLAAHIAAPDPHPQYTTDAEVASAIGAHVALPDPHAQYTTDAEATSLANSAVALHNGNVGAHPGHLADGAAHAATFANHNADTGANSAAFAAHNSNVGAHAGAIGAHNVNPSAHLDIRADLAAVAALAAGGASAILSNQAVEAAAKRGQAVYKDPVTEHWVKWDENSQRPAGVAEGGSTEVTLFEAMAMDFDAGGYVVTDPGILAQLDVGDVVKFVGSSTNTGWKYVTSLDFTNFRIYLRGTVVAEASVTADVVRLSRDKKVYLLGNLPLPRGVTKSPALDLVGADIAAARITVRNADLTLIQPGDRVTVAGSTAVPAGTYDLATVDATYQQVTLKKTNDTVVSAGTVDAISSPANKITFNVGVDVSDVATGMVLDLTVDSDFKGRYTVASRTGQVVLVTEQIVDTTGFTTATADVINLASVSPIAAGTDRADEQNILTGELIAAIDAEDADLRGVITVDAGVDLSSVLAGDTVTISGATNPSNDGNYTIESVNDGAHKIFLRVVLAADQGSPAGTVDVVGPRADGTATFKEADDSANFSFDSSISGTIGPVYYADPAASDRYSKDPGPWMIGILSTTRSLFVYIDETGQAAQASFSSTATLKQTPRQIAYVDGTTTFTLSLPAAPLTGDYIVATETSLADMVTLSGNGKTIDGTSTFPLGAGETVELVFDGAKWNITNYHAPGIPLEAIGAVGSITIPRRRKTVVYAAGGTDVPSIDLWQGRDGEEILATTKSGVTFGHMRLNAFSGETINYSLTGYEDVDAGKSAHYIYCAAELNWLKVSDGA